MCARRKGKAHDSDSLRVLTETDIVCIPSKLLQGNYCGKNTSFKKIPTLIPWIEELNIGISLEEGGVDETKVTRDGATSGLEGARSGDTRATDSDKQRPL